MGFRKCDPFIENSDFDFAKCRYIDKIISDVFEMKNGNIKTIKKHPKWRKFYKLNFSENITIWVISNNDIISKVLLEENEIVEKVFKYDGRKNISSKGDFIKVFPKNIQRNFILSELFK